MPQASRKQNNCCKPSQLEAFPYTFEFLVNSTLELSALITRDVKSTLDIIRIKKRQNKKQNIADMRSFNCRQTEIYFILGWSNRHQEHLDWAKERRNGRYSSEAPRTLAGHKQGLKAGVKGQQKVTAGESETCLPGSQVTLGRHFSSKIEGRR